VNHFKGRVLYSKLDYSWPVGADGCHWTIVGLSVLMGVGSHFSHEQRFRTKRALTVVVPGSTSVTDLVYPNIVPEGSYRPLVRKTSYIEHLSTKPKQKING
jgi:hypothetical protein